MKGRTTKSSNRIHKRGTNKIIANSINMVVMNNNDDDDRIHKWRSNKIIANNINTVIMNDTETNENSCVNNHHEIKQVPETTKKNTNSEPLSIFKKGISPEVIRSYFPNK